MGIIGAIMAFFQAVPSLVHGFEAFTKAHYDAKVKITQARVGGDRDVAVAIVNGMGAEGANRNEFWRVVTQSKFMMALVFAWSFPWIVFEWKVILWDKILCHAFYGVYGYTPPVEGLVADWAGLILGGLFGTGGVMAAGALFSNWRKTS